MASTRCPRCKGDGKVKGWCRECGSVLPKRLEMACTYCRGTGRVSLPGHHNG